MATKGLTTASEFDILNLGCGDDYRKDAWNVDVSPAVDPDERVDLAETPWPWPDKAFSLVLAHHVFEHLPSVPWDEVVRVLNPQGILVVTYPIGHTRFEDPTHRQYWNYHTAAAIAGGRKHGHEHEAALTLLKRGVEWDTPGSRLWAAYTRIRMAVQGPGGWLDQIPGLCGEVTATYRVE